MRGVGLGKILSNRMYTRWFPQFFLALAGLLFLGQCVIDQVDKEVKKLLSEELQLSLKSSIDILNYWFEVKHKISRVIIGDPLIKRNLLTLIEKAQLSDGSPQQLMQIPELGWLRAHMKDDLTEAGFLGFVLFDTNGLQVGALFDDAIGKRELIALSDFFKRSLKSEFVISLPFKEEIPLLGENDMARPATMFVSLPIKDDQGLVHGVMAFRLNPAKEFSRIFQITRSKETGETYIFSKDAILLAESRFNDDLRQIGLLADNNGSQSILQVEIRDPGGNMVEGFRPTNDRHAWPLTHMAEQAVQGKSGIDLDGYNDYRGVPVVGAWTWLPEFGFSIASEIDVAEAFKPVKTLEFWFWLLFSLILAIYASLAIVFWKKWVSDRRVLSAQAQFKTIVDNAVSAFISINEQGEILTFNNKAEKIFGYTEREALGQNIKMLMPEPYSSEHDQYIQNYIQTGKAKIIGLGREVAGLHKNGTTTALEIAVSEIIKDGQRVFMGQLNDINERKKAEGTVKSEAMYSHLGQVVTSIANESDDVDGAFQASLKAICETTGWPVGHAYIVSARNPNILIPTKLWYLKDPSAFKRFVEVTEQTEFLSGVGLPGRVLASKKAFWIVNVHEDDNFPRARLVRQIEVKGGFSFPILVGGEVIAVMEFYSPEPADPNSRFLDIMSQIGIQLGRVVERDHAGKKMLQAKEEAERANAAKSEFLSRMSHELRTPMNAILGFAQLMMHHHREILTENQKENVREIRKAGDHLLELINEVLDLSKIESGEMTVSLEPVGVLSVVEEVLMLMEPVANQWEIQLLNEVSRVPAWTVMADRLRLKQVLMNLVSNAIKYNKREGIVRVMCEIGQEKTLLIHVKDTGSGIPEDKKGRLFQPFERLGAEYTEISGTGIGLTISEKLIGLMGGKIGVSSQMGEGSSFSIELPVADFELDEEEGGQFQKKQARYTVLYVEDNPSNLRLVKKAFANEEEFRLLSAPDAKLGIELVRAHLPDLLLLDIHLPGADGISLMRQLRMYENTQHIPAIAVSSTVTPREIDRALASGFKHYLTKPIDVDQLLSLVKMELGLKGKPGNFEVK